MKTPHKLFTILIIACTVLVLCQQVVAQPIITGIFYDPDGSDTGFEWLELYNPDNTAVNLSEFAFAKSTGSKPSDWTSLPALSGSIEPYSFFLIGESNVSEADLQLKLALYNGPGSIALMLDNESIDLIGYGGLQNTEYFSGNPARDVAAGQALVRAYDLLRNQNQSGQFNFSRTDNNSVDWIAGSPSPRNRLYQYSPPQQDNATVILVVPPSPLQTLDLELSDDMLSRAGVQWSLVNKKSVRVQVQDESGLLSAHTPTMQYLFSTGAVSRLLAADPQSFWNGSVLTLQDTISIPTQLSPGQYNFSVRIFANASEESLVSAASPVDILPTVGVDICSSLEFVKTQDGSYQGTCVCKNTGNVNASTTFSLVFENNRSATIYMRHMDNLSLLNMTTLKLAPGDEMPLTFIANLSGGWHFGSYNGTLTVDAWS